jgi:peptidyl-prolyl cis-trans isomerase C
MLKIGIYSALAILSSLAINPAMAEDKAAAIVNGVSISQTRIDQSVKAATAQGQPDSPDLRKAVRDDLINREVIAQESVKMGLNKDPEVIQQIEIAKQQILIGAFVQDYVKSHPISDDQIKQEYEKLTSNLGEKEYKVRHILVDTEAEAKSIITQLGKKGSFEKIAKAKSKDAGSAANGGELDWAVPSNFVPPFANAMLSLKKGSYTKEPVKSQFGWHIIKLDDERSLKVPPLETVKPQIQQRLQQQALQSTVLDLRAKAKIE